MCAFQQTLLNFDVGRMRSLKPTSYRTCTWLNRIVGIVRFLNLLHRQPNHLTCASWVTTWKSSQKSFIIFLKQRLWIPELNLLILISPLHSPPDGRPSAVQFSNLWLLVSINSNLDFSSRAIGLIKRALFMGSRCERFELPVIRPSAPPPPLCFLIVQFGPGAIRT